MVGWKGDVLSKNRSEVSFLRSWRSMRRLNESYWWSQRIRGKGRSVTIRWFCYIDVISSTVEEFLIERTVVVWVLFVRLLNLRTRKMNTFYLIPRKYFELFFHFKIIFSYRHWMRQSQLLFVRCNQRIYNRTRIERVIPSLIATLTFLSRRDNQLLVYSSIGTVYQRTVTSVGTRSQGYLF